METPETIRTSLQQGEWVTSIDFKDAYFHIPIQEQSRKYLRFHVQGRTYQYKALPFGLSTAALEFTVVAKEVKLMAINKGIRIHQYLDDWLVRARSHQHCLQHTQDLVEICQKLGWLVNVEKSELEPKQIFDFVDYQFDLKASRVWLTPDQWQNLQDKILEIPSQPTCPVRQFMSLIGLLTATEKQVHLGRLHMRPIQWHLKNNWRIPESLEKVIPIPRSPHPHLQLWLQEDNVLTGQPLHPIKHALQVFTHASKEGWGAHVNEHTARKQAAYKLPGTKGSLSSLKRVSRPLHRQGSTCATNNTTVVSYINKELGMKSVCPTMENLDLVYQISSNSKSPTHSGPAKRDKLSCLGQTIQTEWSLLQEVFQAICSRWHRPQIDLFATRFNNKLPQFVSPVRDPLVVAVDAEFPMGGSGCIWLPTSSHLGQSGGEVAGLPMQERVAQHALVLGYSDHVQSDSTEPAQPVNSAIQSDPSQKSDKSKSPCVAPRASAMKEQGFSETVAARIEAPQRRSTRSVYKAKWALFTKWCITNQVDFRAPPVKSVADFLMYLFEDRKLQPSTIDGYRSAIADKLGNSSFNIGKDENLTRLLDSFHRHAQR